MEGRGLHVEYDVSARTQNLLVFLVAECLLTWVAWPYLTGRLAYAPRTILQEGIFSSTQHPGLAMTPRDAMGQSDYFDQERVYLQFYRRSLKNGELPFWNENIYGGISQEDSMTYSWLSPFYLPWLFVADEHIAKGLQIWLLLNFGMIGFFLWGRILNVSPPLILLASILGLLTPLSLHFQAHTQQPAIYFCGLYVTACYCRFLKTGRPLFLGLFFGSMILAVVINYLSILLFISLFLAVISVTFYLHGDIPGKRTVSRTAAALLCYGLALGATSFFLGPIILESHLVREPVQVHYMSYFPFIQAMGLFFARPYVPFLWIVPVLLLWAWRTRRVALSIEARCLAWYWGMVVMVTSFVGLQFLFRMLMPGMRYSSSALFRMLFFSNLFALLLMACLLQHASDMRGALGPGWGRRLLAVLSGVLAVNVLMFAFCLRPAWWRGLPLPILQSRVDVIHDRPERLWTTAWSVVIALSFVCLWRLVASGRRSRRTPWMTWALITVMGAGYAGIYHFQRPNLPARLDPAGHPVFAGIDPNQTLITLEDCAPADWGRRTFSMAEATLAGFRTLDGAGDAGMFVNLRRFWYPLNDHQKIMQMFSEAGGSMQHKSWICWEKVVCDEAGALKPSAKCLMTALGVDLLLSNKPIVDKDVVPLRRAGDLTLYALSGSWSDVTFLPGVAEKQLVDVLAGLAGDAPDAVERFGQFDRIKVPLPAARRSNLRWQVRSPKRWVGTRGTLFMNHNIEYHRGWVFPLLHLPMEGKWRISGAGRDEDFRLWSVPYRIIALPLAQEMNIYYSLQHYWGWGLISCTSCCLFAWVLAWVRRRQPAWR